jgi:hypothetical protein
LCQFAAAAAAVFWKGLCCVTQAPMILEAMAEHSMYQPAAAAAAAAL